MYVRRIILHHINKNYSLDKDIRSTSTDTLQSSDSSHTTTTIGTGLVENATSSQKELNVDDNTTTISSGKEENKNSNTTWIRQWGSVFLGKGKMNWKDAETSCSGISYLCFKSTKAKPLDALFNIF